LAAEQRRIIMRLVAAEHVFTGGTFTATSGGSIAAGSPELESTSGRLISSARAALALSDYAVSIDLFTEALTADELPAAESAQILLERGVALYLSNKQHAALEDWSRVILLPGATVEQIAQALTSRGITWGKKG